MSIPPAAFFEIDRRDDHEWFRPTDVCRGPWDPDACHAGPPTGLLARAAERLVPGQQLVRLTVELMRPIPFAGFRIDGAVVRAGRSASTTELAIVDESGATPARARTLHLAPQPDRPLPSARFAPPSLHDARPLPFPLSATAHGRPSFADFVEVRYPAGEDRSPGPTTLWMRTAALVAGEHPSGFQRVCPLADCGNAISRLAEPGSVSFVNADLTVAVHRPPVGEWVGSAATSRWEPNGIGLSDAMLFDEVGAVGRALQSIIVRPIG